MLSGKQAGAIKIILELHKENKMSIEQAMEIIKSLTDNNSIIQYNPWTTDKIPVYPLITYEATSR